MLPRQSFNQQLESSYAEGTYQTAPRLEPLERATLLQEQCPRNGWLLKAILPCRETGISGEKVIARLLCLCHAVLRDLVALQVLLPSLRL